MRTRFMNFGVSRSQRAMAACMLNLAVLHVATRLPLNTIYLQYNNLSTWQLGS